ncbi:MAG TPA: DUF6297 family protein [Trebonia sp.]|jgi:hypothetical protein|nr:DUF6297 family protein [Trebonia sp.]
MTSVAPVTAGARGASVARVRALTRRGRSGRWLDWYAAAFGVLVAAIYLGNFLVGPLARLTSGTRDLPAIQGMTGLALVIAAAAGLLLLARSLGPLTLSPADASWLLMSPLSRRAILVRPWLALNAITAVAGALLGVLGLAMAGPYITALTPATLGSWIALAAVAGAGLGVALVSALVLAQPFPGRLRAAVALQAVAVVVAVAAVAGQHDAALPRAVTRALRGVPAGAEAATAIVALALGAAGAVLAWARLGSFPADVLWADSARAGRVRLAAAFLNVQLLGWIAEDNYWRRRSLASRPWPALRRAPAARPALVLAWADWRRLGRRPGIVATLAVSSAAPALAAAAITGSARGPVTAAALLAGAIAAASQGCAALRRDTNDRTLRRLLGVRPRAELLARAVLPSLLASGWLALALAILVAGARPGGGGPHGWPWPLAGLLAGPGVAVAALRMGRTAPIDAADMAGVDLPTGSAPSWLVTRVLSVILGLVGGFPLLLAVLHGGSALAGGALVQQVIVAAALLAGYLLAITARS